MIRIYTIIEIFRHLTEKKRNIRFRYNSQMSIDIFETFNGQFHCKKNIVGLT